MLTRVREVEGGYKVTLLTAEGEVDSRETPRLDEAFRWQAHAQVHGVLPSEFAHASFYAGATAQPAKKRGRGK